MCFSGPGDVIQKNLTCPSFVVTPKQVQTQELPNFLKSELQDFLHFTGFNSSLVLSAQPFGSAGLSALPLSC